jgi:hypothetical protein
VAWMGVLSLTGGPEARASPVATTAIAAIGAMPEPTVATTSPATEPTSSDVVTDTAPTTSPATLMKTDTTEPTLASTESTGCDGCRADVRVDGVVVHDGLTVRLTADADDVVVVGDWNCDGTTTPAVLHLPSGALDVFDSWDNAATATRLSVTPDAVGIVDDPLCGNPAVVTANGLVR